MLHKLINIGDGKLDEAQPASETVAKSPDKGPMQPTFNAAPLYAQERMLQFDGSFLANEEGFKSYMTHVAEQAPNRVKELLIDRFADSPNQLRAAVQFLAEKGADALVVEALVHAPLGSFGASLCDQIRSKGTVLPLPQSPASALQESAETRNFELLYPAASRHTPIGQFPGVVDSRPTHDRTGITIMPLESALWSLSQGEFSPKDSEIVQAAEKGGLHGGLANNPGPNANDGREKAVAPGMESSRVFGPSCKQQDARLALVAKIFGSAKYEIGSESIDWSRSKQEQIARDPELNELQNKLRVIELSARSLLSPLTRGPKHSVARDEQTLRMLDPVAERLARFSLASRDMGLHKDADEAVGYLVERLRSTLDSNGTLSAREARNLEDLLTKVMNERDNREEVMEMYSALNDGQFAKVRTDVGSRALGRIVRCMTGIANQFSGPAAPLIDVLLDRGISLSYGVGSSFTRYHGHGGDVLKGGLGGLEHSLNVELAEFYSPGRIDLFERVESLSSSDPDSTNRLDPQFLGQLSVFLHNASVLEDLVKDKSGSLSAATYISYKELMAKSDQMLSSLRSLGVVGPEIESMGEAAKFLSSISAEEDDTFAFNLDEENFVDQVRQTERERIIAMEHNARNHAISESLTFRRLGGSTLKAVGESVSNLIDATLIVYKAINGHELAGDDSRTASLRRALGRRLRTSS